MIAALSIVIYCLHFLITVWPGRLLLVAIFAKHKFLQRMVKHPIVDYANMSGVIPSCTLRLFTHEKSFIRFFDLAVRLSTNFTFVVALPLICGWLSNGQPELNFFVLLMKQIVNLITKGKNNAHLGC